MIVLGPGAFGTATYRMGVLRMHGFEIVSSSGGGRVRSEALSNATAQSSQFDGCSSDPKRSCARGLEG